MDFIKGVDVSTMLELQELGARYYDGGEEKPLLSILKSYGVNSVRLRLYTDPYGPDREPYGAGGNDLPRTIEMAHMVQEAGLSLLLDFQYSDFWADPGKQIKPKAWADLSYPELVRKVEDYTRSVLRDMRSDGIRPDLIQIGNELSNGLLWEDGRVPAYDRIAALVSAGIRGARECDETIPLMIHLDDGGNNTLYRTWFDNYFDNRGEDFELIGLSYYPFWHGPLQGLSDNMADIAKRYDKDLIVAEVSTGFTTEDYRPREKAPLATLKGMATKPALVEKVEYPLTPEGQKAFLSDLFNRIDAVPDHRCRGFYYWEPAWIPVPGSGWATPASLAYMHDPGPCGNEWANQALFDYDGNALPALSVIKDFRGI